MARIQTETGVRNVQTDTYKGRTIEIVTGYEIRSDKWPFHVYIDGHKVVGQFIADRMDEAFDSGFQIAESEIDRT